MDKSAILTQIQREYALGLNYVRPVRIRYRDRIMKWNPQSKNWEKEKLININMVCNYMDTLIASFLLMELNVNLSQDNDGLEKKKHRI